MSHIVKTPVFEGPLDLLLSLIEERRLLINDIALAAVTDDYIAHVERMDGVPMDATAHFILVASTLLLIKSKSLLPILELTSEEEHDIADLERRLILYQKFKALSEHVRMRFGSSVMFERQLPRTIEPLFSPHPRMTVAELHAASGRVLSGLPKRERLPEHVVQKAISLEETIGRLTARIQASLRLSFRDFAGRESDRVTVIVSFLAMLELVKQGSVSVRQDRHFEDIVIETDEIGTPRYA